METRESLNVMFGHIILEKIYLDSHLKKSMLNLYGRHLKKFGKNDEGIFKAKLKLLRLVKDEYNFK